MTTARHFFYKTLLLLLLQLLLQLPLETDRFNDISFKGRAACIGRRSLMLCQLCKSRRCQLCKKTHGRRWNLRHRVTKTTIIQSSNENETPLTRTPPPSPLRTRRRPSPSPSSVSGARPRTRKQTNKDGEDLGKLHDQPFPRERKKYEQKKK
jgi:hypothetical protein